MYCRKCHTLVPDEELICKNCGFDNSTQEDILEETKEIVLNPKVIKAKEDKRKVKKISLLIIVLFIITGVCFYIINDSKHDETTKIETNQDDTINYDKEFNFNNLKMNYPSSLFGASKNTIFYKSNNAFKASLATRKDQDRGGSVMKPHCLNNRQLQARGLVFTQSAKPREPWL